MSISIRPITPDDYQAVYDLWHDPLVLLEQYRVPRRHTAESFGRLLQSAHPRGKWRLQCHAVIHGKQFIGVISQVLAPFADQTYCTCGWNLSPKYWGRGLMGQALELLFDELFNRDQIAFVVSECFTSNTRCLKLLAKLHFQAERLPWRAYLGHLWRSRGRRVVRFRLTADHWRTTRAG